MRKIDRLRREAAQCAAWRGHQLDRFTHMANVAYGICLRCGMEVQVDTTPPPNGIDIGGEALALNCEPL